MSATPRFLREPITKFRPMTFPVWGNNHVTCLLTHALGYAYTYACCHAFSGSSRMAAFCFDNRLLQTQQRELYWI